MTAYDKILILEKKVANLEEKQSVGDHQKPVKSKTASVFLLLAFIVTVTTYRQTGDVLLAIYCTLGNIFTLLFLQTRI